MIDRSKCKKMLVWQNNEGAAEVRTVIDILNDGSCLVVSRSREKAFFDGGWYSASFYNHCKPIPKKPELTDSEIMVKIWKHKQNNAYYSVSSFDSFFGFLLGDTRVSRETLFVDYEYFDSWGEALNDE